MKVLTNKLIPVLVALSMILSSCSIQQVSQPTSTTAPTAPPLASDTPAPSATPAASETAAPSATFEASPTPISDDVWDRISANKKIIVGTSWDYPPFASVNANFQAVGFDIALINEIGNRLDLPMEVQNFTFEGLQNALQVNQIDLAIAAISITPERSSQMSFSPVYYVNQTAVLARGDSKVPTINAVDQLVGYRVGVQRGTTYENWIKTNLVDKGLLQASKMLSYEKAEDAVRDLEEMRVDVVVLGLATASYYSAQKGLRIVGKGFEPQNLAVAMRQAAPRLKEMIDKVMTDMLTDGTILRLQQQYVDIDVTEVVPTPLPSQLPTSTPTPLSPTPTATPPECIDSMKFVADVTYDDQDMRNPPLLRPGEGFVKIWRLMNSGTCPWTSAYRLVYAYGNVNTADMNGKPAPIPGTVLPGSTVDVAVSLIAPQVPYTYQGFWQIQNAKGDPFGQSIWVGITTDANSSSGQPTGRFCEVTIQSPNKVLKPGDDFDAIWLVKNVSGEEWRSDSVDYKFVSGYSMHKKDRYDLSTTIANGKEGKIIVDMIAPDQAGNYTAQWAIVANDRTLCNLTVTIRVR